MCWVRRRNSSAITAERINECFLQCSCQRMHSQNENYWDLFRTYRTRVDSFPVPGERSSFCRAHKKGDPPFSPITSTNPLISSAPPLISLDVPPKCLIIRGPCKIPRSTTGCHSLDHLEALRLLPAVSPPASAVVVRSARLYQESVWVCESEPAI